MKLQPIVAAPGPTVQKPGRRAPVALWILDRALRRIARAGTVWLRLPDGETRRYGSGVLECAIALHDWPTLRRIALNPDLALGEAWMDGTLTVEQGDLYDFLALCLSNIGRGPGPWSRRVHKRLRMMGRRFLMHNPVGRAQKNVAHHYDLGDDLYELFLDPERQYSCAYFKTPADSLETAQEQKMRRIAAKLQLAPGQQVLDIGSGWGGLGLYLARTTGANVTGVTLSVEQQKYSAARARREGLDKWARFELRDYRHETGPYDRIVSVGMFEHVGASHYSEYFAKVASLLTNDGVALVHTIGSVAEPAAPHPWLRKYIFPGGYIPSLSEIAPAIEHAGLIVTDLEVLRLHYAETLKAWRERFLARRTEATALYDERFCRMWEFYLAACEAGFRFNGLVVFQIQLTRRFDSLPWTRGYVDAEERTLRDTPADVPQIGASNLMTGAIMKAAVAE
ncbi:class I SAM-dependent methyltransferase (plasmid) [Labrenzia sp. 5N]|jgi:cyclopropane-fatty-acyl-phospholipid synthase|uniref:SAM-dependent methyltransferase n=1 Tax=Stappiaceae TaxID=2821832 RepID=UPI0009F89F8B|nr:MULTISPECIES: cyclopropane-fatty-acyl-phospholipid synthase family protein [Stappiaceae]MBO9463314.1 class I SAM-dependent methyltransferase [Labrenzia sp. R5_0]NKX68174.1 class I SAM-dependent methyltransferase [Labrenzia sp. 5N]UES53824.1 methyltransferase domain-containing protein [Roseibium aggregatum]UFI06715.1 cyclopropane-fatty-acyl-phospholipid synthase family protein [Roseibium aggregatum]